MRAAGLVSAVGGLDEVRVKWDLGTDTQEFGLFVGTDEQTLLSGSPFEMPDTSGDTVEDGLAQNQTHFVALASRTTAGSSWRMVGEALEVRTGAPVYVDPNADPTTADGLTPQTAFPTPISAILTALSQGGGSVFFLEGDYIDVALPVFDGVHLFGGFQSGFRLKDRDANDHPSILRGAPGFSVLTVSSPLMGSILDGFRIEGGGVASIGIDATDARLSIRNVQIRNCAGRGISLRTGPTTLVDVAIVRSSSSGNGADGLSALGALELCLDSSLFEFNVQEGAELDDLIAPSGKKASLSVRGCQFRGNGTEGLDVDLAPPLFFAGNPGRFSVRVERSLFEGNGADGLLIDGDYEQAPGWSANISVLGSRARANGAAGIHLDLDGLASTLIHRVLASANATDGVLLTSESIEGHALLSTSACLGNGGFGTRADIGNQALLVSHSVFGGNGGGGVASLITQAGVVSSVAFRQPNAWSGALVVNSTTTALSTDEVFSNAPDDFVRVASAVGALLTLESAATLPFGALVETDDDSVDRSATVLSPISVSLTPSPQFVPKVLFVYPPASSVIDDFRLTPGSPAQAAGLALPGLTRDGGIFGSTGAGAPGSLDGARPDLFRFASLSFSAGSTPTDSLTLRFSGGDLDLGTFGAQSIRAVTDSGDSIALVLSLDANSDLLVQPTSGSFGTEAFRIELMPGPTATNGEALLAPIVIPLDPAQ